MDYINYGKEFFMSLGSINYYSVKSMIPLNIIMFNQPNNMQLTLRTEPMFSVGKGYYIPIIRLKQYKVGKPELIL